MDDNVVEDIRLHQETIAVDNNSPLHLIREKELEISGRVLSAKREADEIVTAARKKAAEVVSTAEAEGGAGAASREKAIREEAVAEATAPERGGTRRGRQVEGASRGAPRRSDASRAGRRDHDLARVTTGRAETPGRVVVVLVPMAKVEIIGPKSEFLDVVSLLHEQGKVHIEDLSKKIQSGEVALDRMEIQPRKSRSL